MTDPRVGILRTVYTSVIHDVLRAIGRRNFTLPPRITPLQPEMVLTGPAWTVEGRIDDTAEAHQTLLDWTGLLSQAKPGTSGSHSRTTIWSRRWRTLGRDAAPQGGARLRAGRGLADANFILRLGFPCWRTFHTPRDVWASGGPRRRPARDDRRGAGPPRRLGAWRPRRDGGDPGRDPGRGHREIHAAMQTESMVRKAIMDGVDPQVAYLRHGKF